ncbi:hypothetical protein PDESU_03095 [Pontiella desulfatans]|uniref:Uncharacterized protein n=1 Tax=Pontiella desulfatans TaxID=2750659 RepID=A0A6C2U3F3_PONDE|nr:hypothetical protein [Pontiella desulfatans]VGO14532.1 hypothetical protein PDESU_03095 [Pontiella desulfatans]
MINPVRNSKFHALCSAMLLCCAASTVSAQQATEEAAPAPGTPTTLTTSNGKTARVNLLRLKDGNLTFAAGSNEMTVPADKIKSLAFSMNKEEFDFYREQQTISDEEITELFSTPNLGKAEKLELIFKAILVNIAKANNEGDYAAVVAALEPLLRERGEYMSIENNLQDVAVMLMESYRKLGDLAKVREAATILQASTDSDIAAKGKANLALIAVADKDFETAETLRGELGSEAAKLYLQACIMQAQGQPKQAIQTVTEIIAAHGNDLEWMPESELLSAYLYLDMAMTNSAVNTARQVKNIYAGSSSAGDAAKLFAQLGGVEETAEKAE